MTQPTNDQPINRPVNNTPHPGPGPSPVPAPIPHRHCRRCHRYLDMLYTAGRCALPVALFVTVLYLPIQIGFVSNSREASIQATGYSTLIGICVIVTLALAWYYLLRRPRHDDGPPTVVVQVQPTLPDDVVQRIARVEDQQLDLLDRVDRIHILALILAHREWGDSETQRLLDAVRDGDDDGLPDGPLTNPPTGPQPAPQQRERGQG